MDCFKNSNYIICFYPYTRLADKSLMVCCGGIVESWWDSYVMMLGLWFGCPRSNTALARSLLPSEAAGCQLTAERESSSPAVSREYCQCRGNRRESRNAITATDFNVLSTSLPLHRCVLSTVSWYFSWVRWTKLTGKSIGWIKTHDLCIAKADVWPLDHWYITLSQHPLLKV